MIQEIKDAKERYLKTQERAGNLYYLLTSLRNALIIALGGLEDFLGENRTIPTREDRRKLARK